MISWGVIAEILTPRYWLTWLWTSDRRRADEVTPTTYLIDRRRSRDDKAYLITGDRCYECNRFLSWHSDNNGYCSYHNVKWASPEERRSSYQLFKNTFEMWLRSRCGGDLDEGLINTQLLTLSSYLDYAKIHTQTNSNLYDFCDDAFCDYQLVFDFLIDMRQQAQENGRTERHTPKTEVKICEALHRFIEFRKFQLPIKGIVENKYSATERMLDSYKTMVLIDHCKVSLISTAITKQDIDLTVNKFLPQYDIIINYFTQCDHVRSMENGTDIEFATSFVCAYLYSIMPEHVSMIHMVRVRDLCLDSADTVVEYSSEKRLDTELTQYVSCKDLPSPLIASACINKLQKCVTLDEKTNAIVQAYITLIRPRITKSNDYLLLSTSALGLTPQQVHERIITLVYRVTGKVTYMVDRFSEPESSTPRPQKSHAKLQIIPRRRRTSKQNLRKIKFNQVFTKKVVKRYTKNNKRFRRKLVIDLSKISQE